MRKAWLVALLLGVGLPLTGALVADPLPALRLAATAAGGGAAVALLLFAELTALGWLGMTAALGSGLVLLTVLLRAAIPPVSALSFGDGLTLTTTVIGGIAVLALAREGQARRVRAFARTDLFILAAATAVAISTLAVADRNGYVHGPDGREEFHARGFVNGDTFTLFALTNASAERGGAVLLRENPFAGWGSLEYPTLVHRALADVLGTTGGDITRVAWWLVLVPFVGAVAVAAAMPTALLPRERIPAWGVLVFLGALGATWESFTYPQSHSFLIGLFLLVSLLLVRRDQGAGTGDSVAQSIAATVLAVVLLFSNAVLGAAAVAWVAGAHLLRALSRGAILRERVLLALLSAGLVAAFAFFPPGEGALGKLNFAYTAFPQFLAPLPLALGILWVGFQLAWLHRSPSFLAGAVVLPALAVTTLLFSARDIVAENSPRFLFLLLLVGWPLLIPLLQRVEDWWAREVRHVEHDLAEQLALWGGALVAAFLVLLPFGAGVAGALDPLLLQPPKVVTSDELTAFAWIRAHTPTDAVFLRAPESLFSDLSVAPLGLSAFTGRAQLRSEYWLSPDDALLEEVQRFFRGETPPPSGVRYLFCGPEVRQCPSVGTAVFHAGDVTVQALHGEIRRE